MAETTDPGIESLINAITSRIMARFDARFAVIERRLPPEKLRSPLEADKRATAAKAKSFAEVAAVSQKGGTGGGRGNKGNVSKPSPISQQVTPVKGGEKKGGAKVTKAAKASKAPTTPATPKAVKPQQPAADKSEWMTVDRRGGKTGGVVGKAKAPSKAAASAPKKAPSSIKRAEANPWARARVGRLLKRGVNPPSPVRSALPSRQPCC